MDLAVAYAVPEGHWVNRNRYSKPVNRSIGARFRQLLLWRLGRLCTHEMIFDVLWGDDPSGGPMNALNNVKVLVCRLRKRGWDIETWHGVGVICHSAPR